MLSVGRYSNRPESRGIGESNERVRVSELEVRGGRQDTANDARAEVEPSGPWELTQRISTQARWCPRAPDGGPST